MKRRADKPRRRWSQRLIRWTAAALLLAGGLYVSLPWWLPRGMLARQIAAGISAQTGGEVRIDSLEVSWGGGLEIAGLSIADPADADKPMATVRLARADFSPLTLLATGRLDWLELATLELRAVSDGKTWNIAPLLAGEPPDIGRLTIRDSRLTISAPGLAAPLTVRLCDAQVLGSDAGSLAQVSLTAELVQGDAKAPLVLNARQDRHSRRTTAQLSFGRLDISAIGLEGLGDRSSELDGLVRGTAGLELGASGVVERFNVDIHGDELVVGPPHGQALPVVNDVRLRLSGTMDPLTGEVTLSEIDASLPGIAASGSAMLCTAWQSDPAEMLHELRLGGSVQAGRLAAMLGRDDLAAGGSVAFDARLHREGQSLELDLSADASAARLALGDWLLKAAGTAALGRARGRLDLRDWRLTADGGDQGIELSLGDNRMVARVGVADVRSLGRGDWTSAASAIASLAGIEARCEWRLADLAALKALLPALSQVRLEGALAGRLALSQFDRPGVSLSLGADEQTRLAVGDVFLKPPGRAISLHANGLLGPGANILQRLDVDLFAGEGRFSIDDAEIHQGSEGLSAYARIDATDIEQLMQLCPLTADGDFKASGNISGTLACDTNDGMSARLDLDCGAASLMLGDWLDKPRNKAFNVRLTAADAPVSLEALLTCDAGQGRFHYEADDVSSAGTASMTLLKAQELSALVPAWDKLLAGGSVSGKGDVSASFYAGDDMGGLRIDIKGDELEIDVAGRRKQAGDKLRLLVDVTQERQNLAIDGKCELADNSVAAGVRATVAAGKPMAELGLADLLDASATLEGSAGLGESLLSALPELKPLVAQYTLDGSAGVKLVGRYKDRRLGVEGTVDADKLALKVPAGPDLPAWLDKAAGQRTQLQLTASLDADKAMLSIDRLGAALPGVSASVRPQLQVPLDGLESFLRSPWPLAGVADVNVTDAATTAQLSPAMATYKPSGALEISADVRCTAESITLGTLSGGFSEFRAHLNQPLRLGGQVVLKGVWASPGQLPTIESFTTDGLSWQVGQSNGYMLADLRSLPLAATGSVEILAQYIDDQELLSLLAPVEARQGKMDGPQARQTKEQARRMLDAARPYLAGANIQFRLDAEQVRSLDNLVAQVFDVRQLRLNGLLDKGQVHVNYTGGLYGGTMRNRYDTNAIAADATLRTQSSLEGVIAVEQMQPQLARYFPGNTVFGTFDRRETVESPLVDAAAFMLDWRYPLAPRGEAITVTTDGVVTGRAAPKWVTRVFPGLNLTTYRYDRMTSFTDFNGDGSATSDMVFSGASYDMYIEGDTDAQNIGRYEIGLILLGTPQSAQWNHQYRQGRIPLLNLKARIEDGRMYDDEVRFLWPNQTLFTIFLKNNIFYRLWLQNR